MRILYVTDSLEMGGSELHVVRLARSMRRLGNDVSVACSIGGPLADALEQECIPTRPLLDHLVKRRISHAYARALRALIHEEQPHLVHAHNYASSVAAAAALVGIDVPLVVTEHSEALWRNRWSRCVSRWLYDRTAHVIAVS